MRNKCCFTERDIVVALGCGLFLLMTLGSIGDGGRRRAKEAVCVCNLKRWGDIWKSYTDDHDGYFAHRSSQGGERDSMIDWQHTGQAYYKDPKLLFCPEATRTWWDGARNPFMAWLAYTEDVPYRGSYCVNLWISNEQGDGKLSTGAEEFWRTPHVAGAESVPVLADGQYRDADPVLEDQPPRYEQDVWTPAAHEMQRFCISRHNGAVNILFLDFSVRKVGLKHLWRQPWHRTFDLTGPLPVWPAWMANFKAP
jgi:prepilin-type processing-associated H-X9-DG protein